MSSPSTFRRMEADQTRAYRAAVEVVEARLGVSLPRFRGVQFCVADYQKPANLGQGPYYRRFPGLTAKPYWDASEWPSECRAVLDQFEGNHTALLAEFEAGIPDVRSAFRGQSTGYYGVADKWLSYPLVLETGEPVPEAFATFPRLAQLLAQLVALQFPCKTYFALMTPGVHLAEHCGGQNIALRMHFALRIPPGDAVLRVGGIDRHWENGKSLFFDDTFVHEAWNRTGQDRYILLMRIMHPELSAVERSAYFLIEEEFRGSGLFLAMKAEILAEKAAEAARAKRTGVGLSSVVASPTAAWALDPRQASPFLSNALPGENEGDRPAARGRITPLPAGTTGAFPRVRAASALDAQLHAAPGPKWRTFTSPFNVTGKGPSVGG